MKKILFAASAGLLCFCMSCNNESKSTTETSDSTSSQAQKNLAASHVVNKAFETGDASGIDSVVAEDFLDHTGDHGDVRGRDSLKKMINMVHTTFKDMKMELTREMANDDYVYSQMRFTGTGDGKMMPPGPYDMHVIEVVRFKDGKIVEHWEYMDMQDMMKMQQDMMKTKPADSTKMKKK